TVRLTLDEDKNYLRGQRILVTGAGGSIGAEICRQVTAYEPERLILLGRGENSIYEIATELGYDYRMERMMPVIADVRDERKMASVFAEHQPAVVFHAAAHKHVPLMELHPDEAIGNNVFGTINVARLAERHGAKHFVMISTDKAVRPTNVMGASKRVAEMAVQQIAARSSTFFHTVRFGNVLGSRGSVIPLLQRQVRQGGPVTVTHRETTRYFMTIPEAVSLLIQTGALGSGNQLFLLDMGQPVRILDLARNIITLSGYEPDVDIEIEFIGLRPGEKLTEELLTEGEGVRKTDLGKIFVVDMKTPDNEWLDDKLAQLRQAADEADGAKIRAIIKETVPDYEPYPASDEAAGDGVE
ncbi:UDP-N-acetylglucosamine 4,6-dehydratase family protein, partial [Candidatus Sumerlaeota bacterium]